ncbi:acyl-CoA dehydrogenase [Rhodopseudomonas palustris HaA2]|uniref:Acyl-CoA dehydrogenase n=1 Tax=Rhodopseudomonas palustris (strain HaA2) TaxID=316058 RepID=Q2ISL9_RHOP2|nr:acyl-CoA dehydrogenase family protein [Rhodopseudomonas palustris]ABD08791.1 acyl-CoA dehydrogenase [Rhodopseudomonas palustris HaA2]
MIPILSPTHTKALIDRSRLFATTAFDRADKADATATIDSTLWSEFHRSGLAMAAFPERLGGSGLCENERQGVLCTVLRMVGAGDLSIARLFEGHVNAISLVCRYGTEAQIASLAIDVADGATAGVWGADDAAGLTIVGAGNAAELRGRKILASGAGFVTRPIVTAKAGDDQLMCLLRLALDYPVDLSGWTAQGMRSTATGAVELSGIAVGGDEIVGVAGDFMRQPYFSGGAWRFCAAHLGAMERLVDLFRDHLISRGRGEDPYQLQRVAHCVAAARTARFWVEEAARRFGSDDKDASAVVGFTNMTRMVTERSALDIMEAVQRGVGLPSFIRPSPIERICRDLATYLRQPVPDLAMSDAARSWLRSSVSVGDF